MSTFGTNGSHEPVASVNIQETRQKLTTREKLTRRAGLDVWKGQTSQWNPAIVGRFSVSARTVVDDERSFSSPYLLFTRAVECTSATCGEGGAFRPVLCQSDAERPSQFGRLFMEGKALCAWDDTTRG